MIRVLVVDDSPFMRRTLSALLNAAGDIVVVDTARDGGEAVEKTLALRPDVVTLDVEMPSVNGLEALRRIMDTAPTPVVMVSSLTQANARTTVDALMAGAVDFVAKPSGAVSLDMNRVASELLEKVRAASQAPVRRKASPRALPSAGARSARRRLLVIGCSTGGPQALHRLVPALPPDLPAAVVVVQHMPPGFTRALAERLDGKAGLNVREAEDGDRLVPGLALVAPGGRHLLVRADSTVTLDAGPPLHGVRPAVDATLQSAVAAFGPGIVVAILTGMGLDGALGAQQVHESGGYVLAESEESCVVYGMPRAVVELGVADRVAPLEALPAMLTSAICGREEARR